jgi:hypothetical protein
MFVSVRDAVELLITDMQKEEQASLDSESK